MTLGNLGMLAVALFVMLRRWVLGAGAGRWVLGTDCTPVEQGQALTRTLPACPLFGSHL